MLLLLSPFWWWAAPAIALAGGWALWRGQRRVRAVPSLRLWRDAATKPGTRKRIIDPVWLLIFTAALLAALALPAPAWQRAGANSSHLRMNWSVSSLQDANKKVITEAWIQLEAGDHLPPTLDLEIRSEETPDDGPSEMHPAIPLAQLRKGIAIPIAGNRLTLSINAAGKNLAHATFVRGGISERFAWLESGDVDPALSYLFSIQPEAVRGDPNLRPAVMLLGPPRNPDATHRDADEQDVAALVEEVAHGDPGALRSLIIAGPEVPLPGITLGTWLTAPQGQSWTLISAATSNAPNVTSATGATDAANAGLTMPTFIHLDDVRVRKFREAQFSNAWRVLAWIDTAGKRQPWIALRSAAPTAGNPPNAPPPVMIWLASDLFTGTDWLQHPSFVVFFAEMTNRVWGHESTGQIAQPAASHVWQMVGATRGDTLPDVAEDSTPVELRPYLGVLAAALLLGACGAMLLRNTRP